MTPVFLGVQIVLELPDVSNFEKWSALQVYVHSQWSNYGLGYTLPPMRPANYPLGLMQYLGRSCILVITFTTFAHIPKTFNAPISYQPSDQLSGGNRDPRKTSAACTWRSVFSIFIWDVDWSLTNFKRSGFTPLCVFLGIQILFAFCVLFPSSEFFFFCLSSMHSTDYVE